MSVPAYKRKLSKTEFINSLMQLCALCGNISIKMPKKYKNVYLDKMVDLSADALMHAVTANKVFLSESSYENDYMFRRNNFLVARGEVHAIASIGLIVLSLYESSDDNPKHSQIMGFRKHLGEICASASSALSGILKYDKEKFNKKMKSRKQINPYPYQQPMVPLPPIQSLTTNNMDIFPPHPIQPYINPQGYMSYNQQYSNMELCTIVDNTKPYIPYKERLVNQNMMFS